MAGDPQAEIPGLRTALRDLVALSTIPAAWVGREPSAIAAGLADVLIGSLRLDFAFVRLCDPTGGAAVEASAGDSWKAFSERLQQHLPRVGPGSRQENNPHRCVGVGPCQGNFISLRVKSQGGPRAAAGGTRDLPHQNHPPL